MKFKLFNKKYFPSQTLILSLTDHSKSRFALLVAGTSKRCAEKYKKLKCKFHFQIHKR